jgi:release factor glutamine methyltransferase
VLTLRAAGCVFAEEEARMLMAEASTPAELADMVQRRVDGLPLETIVGWAEFHGLRIAIDAGVFVPRRRTEFLVDLAIDECSGGAIVVDLCCGAGALGVAVATSVNALHPVSVVELYAADIEHPAVECARRNVQPLRGRVYEGDLFEPLPRSLLGRVDILLANVPYVPSDAIALLPPEARNHEPRVTLDGGDDGLAVLRRVSAEASQWLAQGGHVFFETSERQALAAQRVVAAGGLDSRIVRSEEHDATVIVGTRVEPHGK